MTKAPTFFELARQALSSTERGYDLLAPKFEATAYATPAHMIEASLEWVNECYPLEGKTSGADLACGTGRGVRALRASCEEVSGYDFSAGMLAQGAKLSDGIDGLHWVQADLSSAELPEDEFDRIVTFGAWGHILPHFREHFLSQIIKALKPGGVFVTITADDPAFWQRRFWFSHAFDLGIKIRNLIWFKEFHMYYRLNSTELLVQEFSLLGAIPKLEPVPRYPHRALTLFTYRKPI